jgi:hypothetical protein
MNPHRHFCTLFDSNYLLKGVVMLDTLSRHCPEATVHVLCMDETTHGLLNALQLRGVVLLRLVDVEDEELLRIKPGRSIAEYCWTLSAALCWHLITTCPEIETLTYLDADLMFFSNIEPLFDEIEDASIAIIEHRFMPRLSHLEAYGRFNVEWVSFRRNEIGLRCLKTWRDQCIEWCFARLEDGRLGDQKYLDAWPEAYPDALHILQHKGAGVAPWNFTNYYYSSQEDEIMVDDVKLIFYHFHQFQILSGGRYDYMSSNYSGGSTIPSQIYERYISELCATLNLIRKLEPGFNAGIRPATAVLARRIVQKYLPTGLKNTLRRLGISAW